MYRNCTVITLYSLLSPPFTVYRYQPLQFHMSVTVSDGRNHDTTTIEIEVTNVNDLRPVFDPPSYNITVTENVECDIRKVQVTLDDEYLRVIWVRVSC